MTFKKKYIIIPVLAFTILIVWQWDFSGNQKMNYGVTFSSPYAKYLGLDDKETYLAILDDLQVKNLRLLAQWDLIEPKPIHRLNFSDLDWQIEEAAQRGAQVILIIGRRVPRWPECHIPSWAKELKESQKQEKILEMLKKVVVHYKVYNNITTWQIDNEPLLNWFGICPQGDKEFLKKEIALVKSLDSRPILITDSGELSSWIQTAKLGDFLGTTLYRVVWNQYFGYWYYDYIFPPAFYRLKAFLVKKPASQIIISELQAEPWLPKSIQEVSLSEQKRSFDLKRFKNTLRFAQKTGFKKAYLWGAEYWYWLKKQGDDSLWEMAKEIEW